MTSRVFHTFRSHLYKAAEAQTWWKCENLSGIFSVPFMLFLTLVSVAGTTTPLQLGRESPNFTHVYHTNASSAISPKPQHTLTSQAGFHSVGARKGLEHTTLSFCSRTNRTPRGGTTKEVPDMGREVARLGYIEPLVPTSDYPPKTRI
jgi:hypothetical protein